MDYLIEIDRHPSVEDAIPYKILVQAKDFQDAMAQGFENVMQEMLCCDVESQRHKIVAAVATIAEPAECERFQPSERFGVLNIKENPDDDDTTLLLVWHDKREKEGEEPNIGIGFGYNSEGGLKLTGRTDNRWLKIKEWDGNPARRDELSHLDKDEIIDLLIRLEAVG